ncbi:MAG: carboxypeptidase regulatory-like domain-containing protein [Bryobacterales bacterium]|nr:carboxypeptidase regulatory-like domain-containing protein [Bryobacterales bacterium]
MPTSPAAFPACLCPATASRAVVLSLLTLFPALLSAQSTAASVSGVVSDSSGGALPGAKVSARHLETGVVTRVETNAAGFYSLRPLPIGPYTVIVERNGFRRYQHDDLVLSTGQALELPVSLPVGDLAETITVTSETPLLETRSSDASQLIESKNIEEMPMGDRNAFNIVEMTGAAVFVASETGGTPSFSLAGGRVASQMQWVDGGTGQNMRIGVPTPEYTPPIEALQEIKIMGNGFSAEFGASAGGVVVVNTKSGTNKFKGQLFEYFRHDKMDGPNFFSPIAEGRKQKPQLRSNVFGGVLGGPIRRDRTFFFVSYQGSVRGDGQIRTLTVPSARERAGDFTQTFTARGLSTIYDPATSSTGAPRSPFPGNLIPLSRMDRIATNLVPFFPESNRAADDQTGANNFRQNDVNRTTRTNLIIKIDHTLNDTNKITGRLVYAGDDQQRTSVYPTPAADTVNSSNSGNWSYYGTWTNIVSPALIHELRATFARRSFRTFSPGLDEGWPTKLGFQGISDAAFPNIAPAGFAALGSQNQDRRQFPVQQFQLVDTLSWVRGRHSVRVGVEVRPSMNHEVQRSLVSGRMVFSRGFTGITGNAFTGSGFATMLLGIPTTLTFRETDVLNRRTWYLAGYLQNDWAASNTLSLNLGLRWEIDTPLTDTGLSMNSFAREAINPVSGTPGVVKFLGRDGYRRTPYNGDWNNFGPRFGFAWRPLGLSKTVIRGGIGVFFAHPFDRANANTLTLGFERSANVVLQDNIAGVPYTMSSGMPVPSLNRQPLNDSFGAARPGVNPTQAVTYLEADRRTGYSLQPSLRVQHELPGHVVFEWGYIGNLSRKLGSATLETNQIRPELMRAGSSFRDRPFPQFSAVQILSPSLGVSSYHAGIARAEKRFSRGFNLLTTYTWSKSLDNVDAGTAPFGNEGNAYSDYYNRRADWGPSTIDIRHRVTLSSVYQLPFGRGKPLLRTGWGRKLAGGWSLGAVFTTQSGGPVTVSTQQNTTFAFSSGGLRANVLRDPNLPAGERTLTRWFDTTAFAQPEPYTFGNQGVGLVRADGQINLNLTVSRNFRLSERTRMQFRAEGFNVANHPDFRTPNRVFEGPGFGIVSAARPARQMQLGARLEF